MKIRFPRFGDMTSQSIQDGASQLDNAIFPAQQQNCQEKNPVNGNFI